MRVAVDARMLRSGGIGRYLREITGRWLEEGRAEELRFLGHPRELEPWLAERSGAERARVAAWRDPLYSAAAQLRWRRRGAEWTEGCDAVFFPHWDAPAAAGGPPRLLTVHDLTHFLEPDGFPWWKRGAGRILLGRAVARAARVVTVSEASRADLARWFPGRAGQIRVVPNGVDHDVFRPPDGPVAGRWRELQPYLLVVGPLKPHKGVATALEALGVLTAAGHDELRLVQVGPTEVRDPAVARSLANPDIAGRFVQTGRLDDDELNQAYAHGTCLLHPALREGFGLPPLEAMATGLPAIASNRSSLPEVVGTGGILLDPEDPAAWAAAIRTLLDEPEERSRWIARGRERARCFSWDRTADESWASLLEAAAS